MNHFKFGSLLLLFSLLVSPGASAWFIFIPGGLISRALETDPDSISVSAADRSLGKCAGYHVNQAQKFSIAGPAPANTGGPAPQESSDTTFHASMADMAAEKASDKDKLKDLANAYSTRWGRVAAADASANRTYGSDLARNCISNDIPYRRADLALWQVRQDEKKRRQADEVQKRLEDESTQRRKEAEEALKKQQAEDNERRSNSAKSSAPIQEVQLAQTQPSSNQINFSAEAKKSARILGCPTEDVRAVGVDGKNILFSAHCDTGKPILLTCDPSGLCLRK